MKVWVVMGNDFPSAVFDNYEAADAYVKRNKDLPCYGPRRIYWRSYAFTINDVEAA